MVVVSLAIKIYPHLKSLYTISTTLANNKAYINHAPLSWTVIQILNQEAMHQFQLAAETQIKKLVM